MLRRRAAAADGSGVGAVRRSITGRRVGVAAERRAVRRWNAQKSHRRDGLGRKSSRAHARSIAVQTRRLALRTPRIDWSVGLAMIASGSRQVEQLDPRRAAAEHLLAEQRVEVDAAEALLLRSARRAPAGLVVGDDELAVVVELEAVDDAAEARRVPISASSLSSRPMGVIVRRVLELEVAAHEHARRRRGTAQLLVGELEVGEVGVGRELVDAWPERGRARRVERALVGRASQ